MRRFNWESEVFDGQLTAGIEYRFNESQLTALTQDADGDTLYLETEEIRDFSNADPVTGESPLLGEGFALGIYANKNAYAFVSGGEIGNREFTFILEEASSDTFTPYSVLGITDGVDSVYINALPDNFAGTISVSSDNPDVPTPIDSDNKGLVDNRSKYTLFNDDDPLTITKERSDSSTRTFSGGLGTDSIDTTPPELLSYTLSDYNIDLSDGAVTIDVTAAIRDDISGVLDGTFTNDEFIISPSQVTWTSPSGNQFVNGGVFDDPVTGDFLNGTYTDQAVFNQFSENGTWTLDNFSVVDEARNRTLLTTDQLNELGIQTTLEVIGGIQTPPEVI